MSESSTTSWASVDSMAEEETKLIFGANSWLTDMIVRVDDSDSDTSDSEWDQSENGQVVDFTRWQGDSISPISSPTIPQMTGSISLDYDSDDSDDSDGILISCGSYHYDDDYDEEEQRYAEERRNFLMDVNRKWDEEMSKSTDQTDGAPVASKKAKTVSKYILTELFNCDEHVLKIFQINLGFFMLLVII